MRRTRARQLRIDAALANRGAYVRLHFDGVPEGSEHVAEILAAATDRAAALGYPVTARIRRDRSTVFSGRLTPENQS